MGVRITGCLIIGLVGSSHSPRRPSPETGAAAGGRKGNCVAFHELKVTTSDDGSGIVITRREGEWARSVEADEAVILDYDAEGNLLQIEILASPPKEDSVE